MRAPALTSAGAGSGVHRVYAAEVVTRAGSLAVTIRLLTRCWVRSPARSSVPNVYVVAVPKPGSLSPKRKVAPASDVPSPTTSRRPR